jgi:uncharacterized membrane-anchored protein
MRTGQPRWDEGPSRRGGPAAAAGFAASKVPQITVYFWIIKLLSTAMGEATSDYMVRAINPVIAVLLGFTGFVIAMVIQLRAKAYNAWIYWLAVVMVAVFGTQAADVLHIKFHVPYVASTTFYAIVLAVIFVVWYRTEGTLSIHSIRTPRRELFYWATVLATFAMGTATGDMTAKTLNLGYLASGIWFSIAFAAVAVAYWKSRLNPILGFWIAYVLTRPVGASFADYVAFPRSVGGLDVGHAPVALVLTFVIVILVAYLAVTRKDVESPQEAPVPSARHRRAVSERPGYPPAAPYPGQQYPAQRYPGQRYPAQQHPAQQHPAQQHPGEPYHGQYAGQEYAGQPRRGEPYPGQYAGPDYGGRPPSGEPRRGRYANQDYGGQPRPGEPYPGQYAERDHGRRPPSGEPYSERYTGWPRPGEQYPRQPSGDRYPGQHPDQAYPGERYPRQPGPGARYPARPRPGQPGPSAPRRPGPSSRPASPPPDEPWPPRDQRPRREQRPARRSWDDEDESEQTAEGFFAWDE